MIRKFDLKFAGLLQLLNKNDQTTFTPLQYYNDWLNYTQYSFYTTKKSPNKKYLLKDVLIKMSSVKSKSPKKINKVKALTKSVVDNKTCKGVSSKTHKGVNSKTRKGVSSKTHKGVNSKTHKGVNKTHKGVNNKTRKGVNSKTHKGVNKTHKGVNNKTRKGVSSKTHKGVNNKTRKGVSSKIRKGVNSKTRKGVVDNKKSKEVKKFINQKKVNNILKENCIQQNKTFFDVESDLIKSTNKLIPYTEGSIVPYEDINTPTYDDKDDSVDSLGINILLNSDNYSIDAHSECITDNGSIENFTEKKQNEVPEVFTNSLLNETPIQENVEEITNIMQANNTINQSGEFAIRMKLSSMI